MVTLAANSDLCVDFISFVAVHCSAAMKIKTAATYTPSVGIF